MNIVTFVETPYEHTLVQNRWGFRAADSSDFAQHLEGACSRRPLRRVSNLGRDAMLVAPCDEGGPAPIQPRAHGTLYERANPHAAAPESAHGHIAAFARNAPQAQAVVFWAKVGSTYESLVAQKGDRPVWTRVPSQHRGLGACRGSTCAWTRGPSASLLARLSIGVLRAKAR